MAEKIVKRNELEFKQDFPGLKGVNIMAYQYPIEPFLVFTEFLMDRQVFGPHAHAGVSVMTYMLPDSKQGFINRDSNGDFSYIEPGGLHISQAGSGMHHDEFPKVTGIETHGFQIWINHAEKDRFVIPMAIHANAKDILEVIDDNAKIRVLHGSYRGKASNYSMVTDVTLFHIFLERNKTLELNAGEMAFIYGLNGNGSTENHTVKKQTLITISNGGDTVTINGGDEGLECMFGTGTPLNEPVVYGGPFVMTTQEQMAEAKRRYANGTMGKLERYSE